MYPLNEEVHAWPISQHDSSNVQQFMSLAIGSMEGLSTMYPDGVRTWGQLVQLQAVHADMNFSPSEHLNSVHVQQGACVGSRVNCYNWMPVWKSWQLYCPLLGYGASHNRIWSCVVGMSEQGQFHFFHWQLFLFLFKETRLLWAVWQLLNYYESIQLMLTMLNISYHTKWQTLGWPTV